MVAALILGIVQGLTEFLPVSSSGHLILVPWLFGWEGTVDTLAFDVALHAGTLIAVIVYFRRDLVRFLTVDRRGLLLVIVATIPAGGAGLLLEDMVAGLFRGPLTVAAMLATFGLVMWFAERSIHLKVLPEMSIRAAFIIGCAQALALVPGVSRSGVTIAAGLFAGFRREEAARFSFLMSIPVIGGAALLEARHLDSLPGAELRLFGVGFLVSALSGYWAIRFLMEFLKEHRLDVFVYYRWALALAIVAGVWYFG